MPCLSLILKLNIFCKKIKIQLISTPFSKKEADYLVNSIKVPFIKVASMDLNNYPFNILQKKISLS